jgi:predicted Ser/Thr protein kinase
MRLCEGRAFSVFSIISGHTDTAMLCVAGVKLNTAPFLPEPMRIPTVRQLLACDTQHDGHLHRYLFDDDTVRYIKIITGPHNHHYHDRPLPLVPAGSWNWATIDIDRQTGVPAFQTTLTRELERVIATRIKSWNPPIVDHLDLQLYQGKNSNGRFAKYRDSPSGMFGCAIVVKIARFDHEIPDIQKECDVYKLIQGKGIGSKFLAYVAEDGRTIGFVLKKIEGAKRPEPRDFKKCKHVLKKFHQLGLLHQDCHHGNVMVDKGRVILVDFKSATEIDDNNAVEGRLQDFATLRPACGISR